MRHESHRCDRCGDSLPGTPSVFLRIAETHKGGMGNTGLNFDLCQACINAALDFVDPKKEVRNRAKVSATIRQSYG